MRAGGALLLAAAALSTAGCGAVGQAAQRVAGSNLTIYFSGPLHGASSPGARAALGGSRLALASIHGRVGRYRITLRALDDSTAASDGWDPSQTTANARLVVQDPGAIGYLGDFNSGASAISIPVLNRAGIPQISPGSTAVGLTTDGPGAAPGEPDKYYPTGTRTFARVVPTDAVQAVALVHAQRAAGCHSVSVLHDGEVDGEDTALTYVLTAQSEGLRVVAVQAFSRSATSYAPLATTVGRANTDCVLISAIDEGSAARLTEQLGAALPWATIFAVNALADGGYTDGIPRSLDPRVIVVSAMLSAPNAPRALQAAYRREFGTLEPTAYGGEFGSPEPPALFGYTAMELMLGAIERATDGGRHQADRAGVRAALFASRWPRGAPGALRIDPAGDPALGRFGVYRLVAGRMSRVEADG